MEANPVVRKTLPIQMKIGESDVMRVLIMSDTHGSNTNLDKVLELERPYELIIHLGDIEGGEEHLQSAAGCPVAAVQGNNDFFSQLPDEQIVEVAGKRIFITHGHNYYVAAGVEHLIREAKGLGVDMVMFGHTHRPLVRQVGKLSVVNPGSLAYPRQEGHKPSYAVMELYPQGDFKFFLKYL